MSHAATLLFVLAAAAATADAGVDARPEDKDVPRAHQVWRIDGARLARPVLNDPTKVLAGETLGLNEPAIALVGETPVAFIVDERSGDVACVEVSTGKLRWSAHRPKAAIAKRARAGRPGREGKQVSPADDVELSLSADVLSVSWGSNFESKLAIEDGRVLSAGPAKPLIMGVLKYNRKERWRAVQGSLMEIDGRRRVFSLPSYVDTSDFHVLESGARVVLVERDDRAGALLVTWTAQAPKPVVLRRPAVAEELALLGDLLLVVRPAEALTLSKLAPPSAP